MRTTKLLLVAFFAAVLTAAGIGGIPAKPAGDTPGCTVRDLDPQVVLYAIHRGALDDIGTAVAELFALAGQKGIYPVGPPILAYLNNFKTTSSQHWLTEIRMPVDKKALELSGTLGNMTDVKTISAMKVVVTVKPGGMEDPTPVYRRLYTWMLERGLVPSEGAHESFLTNAKSGSYASMKTEIMVPIWEPPSEKQR